MSLTDTACFTENPDPRLEDLIELVYVKDTENFASSQQVCSEIGGNLARIDTSRLFSFGKQLVQAQELSKSVWIGLKRLDPNKDPTDPLSFDFIDGVNSDKTFFQNRSQSPWRTGEPNDSGTEECVELSSLGNKFNWNDDSCSTFGNDALCRRPCVLNETQFQISECFDSDLDNNVQEEFILVNSKMNFDVLDTVCKQILKAQPARIQNETEFLFVQDFTNQKNEDIFIGVKSNNQGQTPSDFGFVHEVINGDDRFFQVNIGDFPWSENEPRFNFVGGCVVMDADERRWKESSCDQPLIGLCRRPCSTSVIEDTSNDFSAVFLIFSALLFIRFIFLTNSLVQLRKNEESVKGKLDLHKANNTKLMDDWL